MEKLRVIDNFFLYDSETNPANVSFLIDMEKFEFNSMRDYLRKEMEGKPRNKSKLITLLGKHYLQEMKEEEW